MNWLGFVNNVKVKAMDIEIDSHNLLLKDMKLSLHPIKTDV